MAPGIQMREIAIIRPMLAVTLPTALPTDISTFPWTAAMRETRSSGRVVATLTTVAPTMSLGMPLISASHAAASTKKSPPFTMRRIPIKNPMMTAVSSIFAVPFNFRYRGFVPYIAQKAGLMRDRKEDT